MDIERFAPHNPHHCHTGAIPPLPDTVEMTGFSGSRHYLEQHDNIRRDPPEPHLEQPLDSRWH